MNMGKVETKGSTKDGPDRHSVTHDSHGTLPVHVLAGCQSLAMPDPAALVKTLPPVGLSAPGPDASVQNRPDDCREARPPSVPPILPDSTPAALLGFPRKGHGAQR